MRLCATFIFALILALPPFAGNGFAADTQPTEYQLKAAYIYHFAQFVDWPASAFPEANSPLIIGVLGKNPFGNSLQQIVDGKVLNNHPLTVREFHSVEELTNVCHILFISQSEKSRLPEIFSAVSKMSTLTVGEVSHFTENGGMVNFVLEDDKIRFQINEINVDNAGLKMSFKLLSLASQLTRDPQKSSK
jgi:hypothetical protein